LITRLRYLAEYGLVRALLAVVLSLGYERSLVVARSLADFFYRIGTKQRRRALENLERAMPELDAAEREAVARQAFRSFVRTFLETAWIPRLLVPGRLPPNLTFDAHPETDRILHAGTGAVLVTGHFGNWELTGQSFALRGHRVFSVARTLDNPWLDEYVTRVRTRYGQGIINKDGGVRGMARVLRDGGMIALLVDQSTGRRGIKVDFMGLPTSTTPAAATLALRFGVPLIPGRGYWTGRGNDYVVRVDAPLMLPRTGDREEDVRALTEAMNEHLANWVREFPGQWLWVHRRWKMRPHWFTEAGDES
jgi:KDO2-lipid IV(A) lauroyltransferase